MRTRRPLAMILAGGEGTRLHPLTRDRAKPSVPFGGKYRIIDFVLSNMVNSGISQIFVLTQFKSQSLTEHLMGTWSFSNILSHNFVFPLPAQMRKGRVWYKGTADAIFQNMHMFIDYQPEHVMVFGGDHIYKMDVSQMLDFHCQNEAWATVAAIPVPRESASAFGIIQVDENWRITGFEEKPKNPTPMPGNDTMALASMGNYIFTRDCLEKELIRDAEDETSSHDFGADMLPRMVPSGKLFAYNFHDNKVPGMPFEKNTYWRDVGTLEAYYEANMELRSIRPEFDLYNTEWPIRARELYLPPAKFIHNNPNEVNYGQPRIGRAINSIVSEGCIVSGSVVIDSILGPNVHMHSYSRVENSLLHEDVDIGEGAVIRNAIIDKHVRIPPGTAIGVNREEDEERGYVIIPYKDTYITAIPKVQRYVFETDTGYVS